MVTADLDNDGVLDLYITGQPPKVRAPAAPPAPPVPPVPPTAAVPPTPVTAGPGSTEGTREMVWSLAYSPDGKYLAIAQQAIDRPESHLRLWDVSKREDHLRFRHDKAGYRTVAISDDGHTMATGVFDGSLTIIEGVGRHGLVPFVSNLFDSGGIVHQEEPSAPINALVFLPHSKTIAAGDWDGWVRFHGPDPVANRNASITRGGSGASPSARTDRRSRSAARRRSCRSSTCRAASSRRR